MLPRTIVSLLLPLTMAASAPVPPLNGDALLIKARIQQEAANQDLKRMLFHETHVLKVFDLNGNLKIDKTFEYEVHSDRDYWFYNLVAEDGKPLASKDLKEETARQEKDTRAVQKHPDWHGDPVLGPDPITAILRAARAQSVVEEPLNGRKMLRVNFKVDDSLWASFGAYPSIKNIAGSVWIDPATSFVLRMLYVVPHQLHYDTAMDWFDKGAQFDMQQSVIDGVLLPQRHTVTGSGKYRAFRRDKIDSEFTFSDFRPRPPAPAN